MIVADDVVDQARSMLGVPYRHQGRSRIAVDCIGLVVVVARELSLLNEETFIPVNYSRRPQDGLLERQTASVCTQIEFPIKGCLALIRWTSRTPPAHCAIVTGDSMIHSYQKVGKVVEHGYRAPWPKLTHSFWLLPGVEYR